MKHSGRQIGAICLRMTRRGQLRVLLVTSRDTGRWVIPKGWPMAGIDDVSAAAIEALQEAGVSGRIDGRSIGSFRYEKTDVAPGVLLTVDVFPLWVEQQGRRWRERDERRRRWFTTDAAARLVAEPELADLITTVSALLSQPVSGWGPRQKVARVKRPASVI